MSETKSLPSILKCVTPTCVCECVIKCFRLRCVCVCLRCSWFRMKDTQKQVIFIKGCRPPPLCMATSLCDPQGRNHTHHLSLHPYIPPPVPTPHWGASDMLLSPPQKPTKTKPFQARQISGKQAPQKGNAREAGVSGVTPHLQIHLHQKKQVPITQKKTKRIQLRYISPSCTYRTRPDLDLLTSENLQEKSQGSQMCHNSRKEALSSVNTLNTLIFSKTNICSGDLLTTSTHIGRQMDFLWGRFVLKALK